MSDLPPRTDMPARPSTPVVEPRPVRGLPFSRSDRAFLASYRLAKNLAQAAHGWAKRRGAAPYKNDDSAASAASRKLIEIRAKAERAGCPEAVWEALGLSASRIAETLAEGMEATAIKPVVIREERVVRVLAKDGKEYDRVIRTERVEELTCADGRTRIEAAKVAATLRGDIRGNRASTGDADEVSAGTVVYTFNIGPNIVVPPPDGERR